MYFLLFQKMAQPKFSTCEEVKKILSHNLAKSGQKRTTPTPNSTTTSYNLIVAIVKRDDAKTITLGDVTGQLQVTIRGYVPPELKVNTFFLILFVKQNFFSVTGGQRFQAIQFESRGRNPLSDWKISMCSMRQ